MSEPEERGIPTNEPHGTTSQITYWAVRLALTGPRPQRWRIRSQTGYFLALTTQHAQRRDVKLGESRNHAPMPGLPPHRDHPASTPAASPRFARTATTVQRSCQESRAVERLLVDPAPPLGHQFWVPRPVPVGRPPRLNGAGAAVGEAAYPAGESLAVGACGDLVGRCVPGRRGRR